MRNKVITTRVLISIAAITVFLIGVGYASAQTTNLTAVDDPRSGNFCASTNGGSVSIDVMQNDINANVIATTSAPGKPTSVAVHGNYAFVGGYRFNIYDVSDPTNPQQVSSLRYEGGADYEQQIRDIHISDNGNYAYLADSTAPKGDFTGASVNVIDISNKSNPSRVGYVAYDDGYYKQAWGSESIDLQGNYIYGANSNPGDLFSIDVSNPTNPIIASTAEFTNVPSNAPCRRGGNSCEGIYSQDGVFGTKEVRVSGGYAYTAHVKENIIRVTDISDPNNIEKVTSVSTLKNPETLEIVGDNYLYVGGEGGAIDVFDISNPSNPSKITTLNLSGADVTSMYAGSDTLFATLSTIDGGDNPDPSKRGEVEAIDISQPASPKTLWAKRLGNSPERVYYDGDYVYVANSGESGGSNSLYIVDPSDGYTEIDSYTQGSLGSVSLDDQGTSDKTDDELVYSPFATGTDSFKYTIHGDPTGDAASSSAEVSFSVQENQCNTDLAIDADPQDVPQKDSVSTTTISWSFDNTSRCVTQNGNTEWRNIDADASGSCSGGWDAGCSGSDSVDITGLNSDTKFTLACDAAQDGDDNLDTSTSTTVTVTDLTACPFVEGSADDEYDDVIVLDQHLSANGPATGDAVSKNLSSDQYDIAFWGYDDARGSNYDRSAQNQPMERWFLEFSNSGGYITSTPSTDDLPDDTQLGTSTDYMTVTLAESIDTIVPKHHAHRVSGPYPANSLVADCIAIDQKTSAPTTNISASTTSIPYNGTTTLDWTYSDVASGTTTSDTGNTEWANTSAIQPGTTCDPGCTGSHSATIDNLTQDTTFTVQYEGAYSGTASDSVSVDVADKPANLSVDLGTVNVGGTTTLSWSTTGMETCVASSDPTDDDWTTGRNPDPDGGTQELTNLSETTKYTLTCEDTDRNLTVSDSATVVVRGFEMTVQPQDIWGVQLPGSVTTQAKVTIDKTSNFSDDVSLSVSSVGGTGVGANWQFIDENGNPLSGNTLAPHQFSDGVWVQGQLGSNVKPGETTLEVSAEAVNSTTSASETINMHIRSIGEQ